MKYTQSKGQDTGRQRARELIEHSAPTREQLAAMPVRDMSRREKRPTPSRRRPSDYRGQSTPAQNGAPVQNRTPMPGGSPMQGGTPTQGGAPAQNGTPMQGGAPIQGRTGSPGRRMSPGMRQRPAQYRYTYKDPSRSRPPDSEIVTHRDKAGSDGSDKAHAKKKSLVGRLFSPVGEFIDEGRQWIVSALHQIKSRLGEFSIDAVALSKAGVLIAVMIVAILAQTTFCRRFTFFGAVPDLMLPFVIAVAAAEGERWGGVFGLAAAFISEALGGVGLTILPIIYMPVGYVCGLLAKYYLTGSVPVRIMYSLCSLVPRALATWLYVCHTYDNFDGVYVLVHTILPEAGITFICSLPMHLIVWALMRPFHKTREQKVL